MLSSAAALSANPVTAAEATNKRLTDRHNLVIVAKPM